jgi:hypothetical protein
MVARCMVCMHDAEIYPAFFTIADTHPWSPEATSESPMSPGISSRSEIVPIHSALKTLNIYPRFKYILTGHHWGDGFIHYVE